MLGGFAHIMQQVPARMLKKAFRSYWWMTGPTHHNGQDTNTHAWTRGCQDHGGVAHVLEGQENLLLHVARGDPAAIAGREVATLVSVRTGELLHESNKLTLCQMARIKECRWIASPTAVAYESVTRREVYPAGQDTLGSCKQRLAHFRLGA